MKDKYLTKFESRTKMLLVIAFIETLLVAVSLYGVSYFLVFLAYVFGGC